MRRFGLLLFVPLSLAAQVRSATVDLSVARMRYADSIDATTMSISPMFRLVDGRRSFNAFGTFSSLGSAASNAGTLNGIVRVGGGRIFGEIEGIAGGSLHTDGARTGQILGLGRVNFASRKSGAWLGAGGGTNWDGTWRALVQGDAGAWIERGGGRAAVRLIPTAVDDTIRYADAFVSAGFVDERLELDASFGFRSGDQLPSLPANRNTWGSVGAAYWLSAALAMVASAGTYPVDFAQGFPGGQFVSMSLRWRPGMVSQPLKPLPVMRAVSPFQVERESGSAHRLRIRVPSARSVELKGDFTGWRPVALSSDGRGWWVTSLPIASGTHELNVRVDAGAWGVPPGLTVLRDEFGGTVGLLVIP